MAEFTVDAELEGETDIDIDFSFYTDKQRIMIARKILAGLHVTFEDVYVVLEGETTVEIEPADRY
jgi:mannose-6-phosphate isomerase-like protein (cupin superfamily)